MSFSPTKRGSVMDPSDEVKVSPAAQKVIDTMQQISGKEPSAETIARVNDFANLHRSTLSEEELLAFAEGVLSEERAETGIPTIDRSKMTPEELRQEAEDFIAQTHQ